MCVGGGLLNCSPLGEQLSYNQQQLEQKPGILPSDVLCWVSLLSPLRSISSLGPHCSLVLTDQKLALHSITLPFAPNQTMCKHLWETKATKHVFLVTQYTAQRSPFWSGHNLRLPNISFTTGTGLECAHLDFRWSPLSSCLSVLTLD